MKYPIIIFGFYLLFQASVQSQTYTFAGKHDSLLFDGTGRYFSLDEDCTVEIRVLGTVEASIKVKDLVYGCGEAPESTYVWRKRKVKSGDRVYMGDEITTGPDGFAKLYLNDGSVIILNKNSSLIMDKEICNQPGGIKLFFGSMWTRIKKALGGGKYEVTTERTANGVRGTEFTVETDEIKDVIKVYEGIVDVNPKVGVLEKHIKTFEEKLNKINDDFQNGRITQEEYVQRMDEFNNEVQKIQDETIYEVNAGYQFTVTPDGNFKDPVLIEQSDNKWFEKVFE